MACSAGLIAVGSKEKLGGYCGSCPNEVGTVGCMDVCWAAEFAAPAADKVGLKKLGDGLDGKPCAEVSPFARGRSKKESVSKKVDKE